MDSMAKAFVLRLARQQCNATAQAWFYRRINLAPVGLKARSAQLAGLNRTS